MSVARRLSKTLAPLLAALAVSACATAPVKPGDLAGVAEVSVPARASTLVIFLSGDGGWWGDLDRKLGERMGLEGYAVVALDTQDWFRERRTPDEAAAHISEIATAYERRTGANRVVLAGYSFGADVLPAAFDDLDPKVRKRVAALVLIAPARGVDLHVTMFEQAGLVKPTIDLLPFYARLPGEQVVCVYGEDGEDHSACTAPEAAGVKAIRLEGGHHFDGDPDHLAAPVLDALKSLAPAN